jgi:STE24 endopeptidase
MRVLFGVSLLFLVFWFGSIVLHQYISVEALEYFDLVFLERAATRAKISYTVSGLKFLSIIFFLWGAYRLSRSKVWEQTLSRFNHSLFRGIVLGCILGVLAAITFSLVSLPFDAYSRFYLERKYDLTSLTFHEWFVNWLRQVFMEILMYLGLGGGAAAVLIAFPERWYLVLGIGFITMSIVLTALYPVFIAPMFDEFIPLRDQTLLSDIKALAQNAGMEVDNVRVMKASAKTVRLNAYFAGLGKTREIVLYDTLFESHSRAEVLLVVAHELGHWRHNHLAKSLVLNSIGVFIVIWLLKAFTRTDCSLLSVTRVLASLFVVSTLIGYLLNPVSNYVSRLHEVQADTFALEMIEDPKTFISTQIKLAEGNLSDVNPPPFIKWFAWTHPTTLERISHAEQGIVPTP